MREELLGSLADTTLGALYSIRSSLMKKRSHSRPNFI